MCVRVVLVCVCCLLCLCVLLVICCVMSYDTLLCFCLCVWCFAYDFSWNAVRRVPCLFVMLCVYMCAFVE